MKMLKIMAVSVILGGCTGIEQKINADTPALIFNKPYTAIGVRSLPSDKIVTSLLNITDDFASTMRTEGLAKNVYLSPRPDDKVDLMIDAKFDLAIDDHLGDRAGKGFITGFLFFLPEPFFWYDSDYKLTGELTVFNKDNTIIGRLSEEASANISSKLLSVADAEKEKEPTIIKLKKSVYAKLMAGIYKLKQTDR